MGRLPVRCCVRVLVVLAVGGCSRGGDGPPEMFPVEGRVTFDGQPVAEGRIIFQESDGTRTDAGEIVDGRFAFESAAGRKTVRITAQRAVEGETQVGAMGEEIAVTEQYLPDRYNDASELTAIVIADVEGNDYEFVLVSKAEQTD